MTRSSILWRFGVALLSLTAMAGVASAASDFSHSLLTFTGNSTQPATQTAVSAAGFNFFDTIPASTVNFSASGAQFGDALVDNEDIDRNYMRTNDADFAKHSFVAEITFVTDATKPAGCTPPACGFDVQDAYFGMGAGNANLDFFRVPDFGTDNASVHYWGENEIASPTIELYAVDNGQTEESVIVNPATGFGHGTHRIRMSYDWFQKKATFSFDLNYAGGAFTPDIIAAPLSTSELYDAQGFPNEPSRIYFGGDEQVVFKNFSVGVTTGPLIMGDFNSSGTVTATDWEILRDNMHTNMSSLTFAQAYALGDLTSDKANDHADFALFKKIYEEANGGGSFERMLSGVPEPSSFVLLMAASSVVLGLRRRVGGMP